MSAFLLFSIQPMFTKMALPLLGGSPTVWSIALVLFQATLLGDCAYAHVIVRRIPLGIGALIHLGALAVAAVLLPIGVADIFGISRLQDECRSGCAGAASGGPRRPSSPPRLAQA